MPTARHRSRAAVHDSGDRAPGRVLNAVLVCLVVGAAVLVVSGLQSACNRWGTGLAPFVNSGSGARTPSGSVRGFSTILIAARSWQDETVSARSAADRERELAMLAFVRVRLRASEGEDVRLPTTAVDQVLDELNSFRTIAAGAELILRGMRAETARHTAGAANATALDHRAGTITAG